MNVLFVCTGNTCRSPMAEALLRAEVGEGITVRSAGVHAFPGERASINALNALREIGIELDHSATLLTEQELEWAHLVLTMTDSHKQQIIARFPQWQAKVALLSEFVGFAGNVQDPYGGTLTTYRQTRAQLEQLTAVVAAKLKRGER